MIKGITKNKHGYLDYMYVPMALAAPSLVGFEEEEKASITCRTVAATVLGYTLLTDAKWGVVKLIPYKTHAALDFTVGVFTLAASFLPEIRDNKKARNTLLLMGITGLVVGTLSLVGAKKK